MATIEHAIDTRTGSITHIDSITRDYDKKHFPFVCIDCGAPLIPKRGKIMAHHFAHHFIGEPTKRQLACKRLSKDTAVRQEASVWKKEWISRFDSESTNRRIISDEFLKSMKADVLLEDKKTVMQFIHTEPAFKPDDNLLLQVGFFGESGYKTVFVFDDNSIKRNHISFVPEKNIVCIQKDFLARLFGKDFTEKASSYRPDRFEMHFVNGSDILCASCLRYNSAMNCFDAYCIPSYLSEYQNAEDNITDVVCSKINDFTRTLNDHAETIPSDIRRGNELITEYRNSRPTECSYAKEQEKKTAQPIKTKRWVSSKLVHERYGQYGSYYNISIPWNRAENHWAILALNCRKVHWVSKTGYFVDFGNPDNLVKLSYKTPDGYKTVLTKASNVLAKFR